MYIQEIFSTLKFTIGELRLADEIDLGCGGMLLGTTGKTHFLKRIFNPHFWGWDCCGKDNSHFIVHTKSNCA